jgi:hypothetical protein
MLDRLLEMRRTQRKAPLLSAARPLGVDEAYRPCSAIPGGLVGPRVTPHAAPERAGAGGPLRPPAGGEGSGRGRTGDEPARERGKAAAGPAAPRPLR